MSNRKKADAILAELGLGEAEDEPTPKNPRPKQMPTGEAPVDEGANAQRAQKLLDDLELEGAPKTGFEETKASKNARQNAVGWKGAALPAAGAAAGMFAGPALLGGAMGASGAALLGEMAGGGLGELANQSLGITEPSNTALALNTLSPVVGRAAAGAIQHAPRLLPNSVYAIRAGLVDRAMEAPGKHIMAPDSASLYAGIPKAGQPGSFSITSMPETEQTIKGLRSEIQNPTSPLSTVTHGPTIQPMMDSIEQNLHGSPAQFGNVPAGHPQTGKFSLPTGLPKSQQMTQAMKAPGYEFEDAIKLSQGLGKLIADTPDSAKRGAYRQLYRSVMTDLENLPRPAGSSVDQWNQARSAYKKEIAKNDLTDAIEKAISSKEGVDQLNADAVRDFITGNKEFRKRLDPKELASLEKDFENMASFTGKRSNKLLTIMAGSMAGGGVGGAAAGYVAADVLAAALMKPGVRKALTKFVTAKGGKAGQDAGAILAAAASGALGNDPNYDEEH